MTTNELAAHSSVMGGSTAERRIMCTKSLTMEASVPYVDDSNEYALEGSALHSAMENILLMQNPDPKSVIGNTYFEITIDMDLYTDKIKPAYDAFMQLCEDLDITEYWVEVRAGIPNIPGAFGTVDILGKTSTGALAVIDWKFGDGRYVEVEHNYQLMFYAACAIYTDDKELIDFINTEQPVFNCKVLCGIIQPRRGYDEEICRLWETTSTAIYEFVQLAKASIEKGRGPEATFKTGKHCWKCKAELICPEKQKAIGEPITEKPELMSPIQLSQLLNRCDELDSIIKSVRAHAHKELERGVKVPGFKLVKKRPSRVYADESKAAKVLVDALGEDAYKKQLQTPAQAETLMGKKEYVKYLQQYVEKKSSGTTVAPDSDKRPDVSDAMNRLTVKKPATGSLFD